MATSNFEEVNAACTNKRGSKGVEFDALSVLTEVSRILLLDGILVLYDEQLKNIPQGPSTKRDQIENDALRMETLLVSYFSEIVEKLSVDYFSD